jgi:hypothetical protein
MKTRGLLLMAIAAAGVFASFALASPPTGKGESARPDRHGCDDDHREPRQEGQGARLSQAAERPLRPGQGERQFVAGQAEKLGDVLAGAGGACPGPIQNQHTTSTNTTTTV